MNVEELAVTLTQIRERKVTRAMEYATWLKLPTRKFWARWFADSEHTDVMLAYDEWRLLR